MHPKTTHFQQHLKLILKSVFNEVFTFISEVFTFTSVQTKTCKSCENAVPTRYRRPIQHPCSKYNNKIWLKLFPIECKKICLINVLVNSKNW